MERYICIHGHFYQPPRENPWLEEIELQDSAYPYHDWNERITAECYAANAASRILDDDGRIEQIVNNYSRISFNFGPSLLSWMQEKDTRSYDAILRADQESQKRFSGHGSALAQAYNHLILPLASERDIETQVAWGVRDFERRFRRRPEGMWLPETAVDIRSLEALAEHGMLFTILAPHQARRVRRIGDRAWKPLDGAGIDPAQAYLLRLPSGRSIALFFYDGPISRAVAFEQLLNRGENFAGRLVGAFSDKRTWPQLVHIATDGETYGHHHRYGEMGLAYALDFIESNGLAKLTNYGEYLERNPPVHEVQIHENTAWSCAHGIERWRSDCGCCTGGNPDWNQAWRGPLRDALDGLRDSVEPLFEIWARKYFKDPWQARNDYIEVILDRSAQNVERFLARQAIRPMEAAERVTALKLLELQRHALLMYTSCGWFFDDLSGIETIQVMQYAGRVTQLAQELFGDHLESKFLDRLEKASSNLSAMGNGRSLYERFVRTAKADLPKVAGHFAMRSIFGPPRTQNRVGCYTVDLSDFRHLEAGKSRLVMGRARVNSTITTESQDLFFVAIHLGDQNMYAGVRAYDGDKAYQALAEEMSAVFRRANFSDMIRAMDTHFPGSTHSLKSLFRDEQRETMHRILDSTLAEAEAEVQQLYHRNVPLIRFLADLGMPQPRAFKMAAEFVIETNLRHAFEKEDLDVEKVRSLLEEAREGGVKLDSEGLAHAFGLTLNRLADRFAWSPDNLMLLKKLKDVAGLLPALPFHVELWLVQNAFYEMLREVFPQVRARALEGEEDATEWCDNFSVLGERLRVLVR